MKLKKAWAPVLTAVMVASLFAGCASTKTDSGTETTAPTSAATDKPAATDAKTEITTIKAMTILFGDPPVTENNQAKADIEKRGNVKLDVSFVPSAAYADKLSVSIAAGDQYDMILMDQNKDDKFTSLVKQGAFYDLTPFIKDKANLGAIDKLVWNNIQIDGKYYGIPRPRGLYGGGEANIIIRQDWLDKYNLPLPKTLDEFTNVLKVFKEKDPAGGGKTIPFSTYAKDGGDANSVNPGPFGGMAVTQFALGLPNVWKIDNGKPVRDFQTPEYKTYVDWIKNAYENGLIDKDAPVLKNQGQARAKFESGIVGAFLGNAQDISEIQLEKVQKADPNGKISLIPVLEGPDGKKGSAVQAGYYGLWAIPSSVSKDKVQKIVDFLDFSANEENFVFYKAGIVGLHSTEFKDGIASQTPDQLALFKKEQPNSFVLENRTDPYIYANSHKPEVNKQQKDALDGLSQIGIINPFIAYNSPTSAKTPDGYKKISAALMKYTLGSAKWEDVQKEIDAWAQGVGATIGKELIDQYNADHK